MSVEIIPDLSLRLAILCRAVLDVFSSSLTIHEKRDAREWIFSDRWEDFSFLTICEILNISPKKVRDLVSDETITFASVNKSFLAIGFDFFDNEQGITYEVIREFRNRYR